MEKHKFLENIHVSPEVSAIGKEMKDEIYWNVRTLISASNKRQFRLKLWAAAASVALLFCFSSYHFYQKGYNVQHSQLVEMSNPLGLRSSVTLSDGTKVTLNAGTILKFPSAFIGRQRQVEVEGEAYFEVMHNKDFPFVVKAGDINVKVLGTVFNVKAYGEEEEIEVTLVEGKVSVKHTDRSELAVSPGEQVLYNKQGQSFSKQKVNPFNRVSWKDGKYNFEKNTLEEIVRQLERSFNVHINIATAELKNVVFSGDFVRGENLEQILRVISVDKRIGYQIQNDNILIFSK